MRPLRVVAENSSAAMRIFETVLPLVDMETSAVFSVSQHLGVKAAALLMASDLHPLHPEAPKWEWLMSTEMRRELTEQSLLLAKQL